MPTIGLGTDFIHDTNHFHSAIMKDGYRLIDTAAMYKNEEYVGEALNRSMKEGVAREDLFIITKLWMASFKDPETALRAQLAKLQLDYVDCFYIHWPAAFF
jgi:diketogulonate reductase-like aldo/keto reductase